MTDQATETPATEAAMPFEDWVKNNDLFVVAPVDRGGVHIYWKGENGEVVQVATYYRAEELLPDLRQWFEAKVKND